MKKDEIKILKSDYLEEIYTYGMILKDQLGFYINLVNKVNIHFNDEEDTNTLDKKLVLACYELIEEINKLKIKKGE